MAVAIEFETARLRLRDWCDADREPFAAMNEDPVVMEYFPAPGTRAGSDAMIDRWRLQLAQRGWANWAVEIRASGEFIGYTGLSVPRADLPFMPCVEIGWRLAHRFWGQGYATEAARGCLEVGFERLGLGEIVSFTTLANRRSRAVMERIGMKEAPGRAFEHPAVPAGSSLRPHCLYKLSRIDWERRATIQA